MEKAPQEKSVEMTDDHIDQDVLRDEHDDYDDSENENGSNDDDDGGDDEDWFTCVGQFQYMLKQLSQSNAILQEIEMASCPDQEGSLRKIVSATSTVKEAAKKVLKTASNVLGKIENAKAEIVMDEVDMTLPSRDPGERPPKLSENQKKYLILVGPDQPLLNRYPTNEAILESGHRQCRFNPEWFKQYPHLEYSKTKDAAFCFACSLFSDGPGHEKSETVWVKGGVRSWHKFKSVGTKKKGKLALHFSSKSHQSSLDAFANFSSITGHVDVMIHKDRRKALIQEEETRQRNRKVVEILFDVTKVLGRQGLSFRGHGSDEDGNFRQIVLLLSRHCMEMKQWLQDKHLRPYHVTYLSAQSQNEFMDIIGKEVQRQIISEIKEAGMYAIMADTTPDVSHKDRLALACRYVSSSGQPTERLISLGEAKDKRGEGGATEIIDTLNNLQVSTDGMCFQSYDYAAAMSGKFNGVQRKLQDKLDRAVPYIPCLAHRTNTAVEHSCNASPIMKDLFDVLEEIYVFFTSSTKRSASLNECMKHLKLDNTLQLRNLSKTRWTARAESIRSVWHSIDAIAMSLEKLQEPSNDAKTKTLAAGLLTKINRCDFIIALMFGKNIMNKTQRLTEVLQSEGLNINDAMTIMDATLETLKSINSKSEDVNAEIDAAIAFANSKGLDPISDFQRHHRRKRPPLRIDDNPGSSAAFDMHTFYRREFKAVLDTQISFLSEVYLNCCKTVQPITECLGLNKDKPKLENFQALASFFPEEIRPDPETLMSEVAVFRSFVEAKNKGFILMSDIGKFANENKAAFPLTANAYRLALTAPVTVAKNERSFSKLKLVKTIIRSKMLDERLQNLILMACEKDITDKIRTQELASVWATLKSRRVATE